LANFCFYILHCSHNAKIIKLNFKYNVRYEALFTIAHNFLWFTHMHITGDFHSSLESRVLGTERKDTHRKPPRVLGAEFTGS